MKIVGINKEQFDQFSKKHKYKNYYQSIEYGNTMMKFGYNVQYLGIINERKTLIGATLLMYKDVFLNYKIAYAPRGILFNYERDYEVKDLVENLKKILGKQGFILLRIDPLIPSTIRDSKGNIMNFNNQYNTIMKNLVDAGFRHKGKTLFFEDEKPRWQSLILLNKDIRQIFNRFDKRTRHKIRKAANSGVEIYKSNDIDILYQFIKRKTKKPIRYYKELMNNFKDNIDIYYARLNTEIYVVNSRRAYEREMSKNDEMAREIQKEISEGKKNDTLLNKKMESDKLITAYKNSLLVATDLLKKNPDGLTIGGAMIIKYDGAAYIFSEGIDETYGYLNANYLIRWQLINDYTEQGLKYINLNAIVGEFEKKNPFMGLNESKLGFNATITEYIGEFDIILNNFAYNLYKRMNK